MKKEVAKGKDLEKAPKKEEKPSSAPISGSRNETRVCPRQSHSSGVVFNAFSG